MAPPRKTLGLIHTTLVFVTVETMMRDLFAEIMPDVRLINIIDDSLLPDVMASGAITPAVTQRMCAYVQAAEQAGCDAVLSLCSSLGPAVDQARPLVRIPVIKIDEAMAEQAVTTARRVGVMATVGTTLGPTVALVEEKARQVGRAVEVVPCLVPGAFEALMTGEKVRHDGMVLEAAEGLAPRVDLIVFAQASMTRLAPLAQSKAGRPVLTSPRRGIEHARRVLDSL